MSRFSTTPEQIIEDTKFQLAQLAYDVMSLRLHGHNAEDFVTFDEKSFEWRAAFAAGVWAAVEVSKLKANATRPHRENITMKQRDNGYLIYSGVRLLIKDNPGLYTYQKFPEELKDAYRALAEKLYYKMEADEEGEGID